MEDINLKDIKLYILKLDLMKRRKLEKFFASNFTWMDKTQIECSQQCYDVCAPIIDSIWLYFIKIKERLIRVQTGKKIERIKMLI